MTGDAARLFHPVQHDVAVAVEADFRTRCRWPDSSPLRHSFPREREKYTAWPVATVSAAPPRWPRPPSARDRCRVLGDHRHQAIRVEADLSSQFTDPPAGRVMHPSS
jgi:hypothetical protein